MHLASIVLLAAAGVSAHPSGHAHLHARFHANRNEIVDKRDGEVIVATIDGKVVSWTQGAGSPFMQAHRPTPAPTPVAVATPPPVAPAAPTAPVINAPPNNAAAPVGNGLATFEGFAPCNKKRATAAQIGYQGNVGCSGYGTNVKLVQAQIADKYQYTAKVVGGAQAMQCKVWNKIGPTGGINGFFNGNEALTFTLDAGGVQYLAFDHNSQVGFTCGVGSVPLTSFGQFSGPWAEADFGNESNNGWSGFDASQLVAGATGGAQKALSLCTADMGICSKLFEGGGGNNAFLPGMEALDGIGGNIPAGPLHLVAQF